MSEQSQGDRLANIRQHLDQRHTWTISSYYLSQLFDDLEWLIAEVERLRADHAELHRVNTIDSSFAEFFAWLLNNGVPVPPQSHSAHELLAVIDQLQALPADLKPTLDEIESEVRRFWAETHRDDSP